MIYEHLDQLPATYAHIYLSPHLDDAALSCGGAIVAQRAAGEGVLVVTMCTAAPPADADFSPLALEFHREWGLSPEEAVAARLREDAAAVELLGADSLWAGVLDAIYRHPAAYHSRETLFNAPDPADPLLAALAELVGALRARMPGARIYAPMGVGCHVDHQITCAAALARAGAGLALYEDFPYVARAGALEERMGQLGLSLRPEVRPIGGSLARKIAAVQAYASQMAELANSQLGRRATPAEAAELMAAALSEHARSVDPALAERVWVA